MENQQKQFSGGRKYKNDEITVYWKPSACVHASYCYRELIEVFDPGRRPWIDLKGSTTARIIEVVNMCPTEALTWKWNDEERNATIGSEHTNHVKFMRPELVESFEEDEEKKYVSVKVMADGPVIVKGYFTLLYGENKKEVREGLISLCRCGRSNQMPFCDGHHRKVGFIG